MHSTDIISRRPTQADEEKMDNSRILAALLTPFDSNGQLALTGELTMPPSMCVNDVYEAVADRSDRCEILSGMACTTLVAQVDELIVSFEINSVTCLVSWKAQKDFERAVASARQVRLFEQYLLSEWDILAMAQQDRSVIPQLLEMMEETRNSLISMAN